MMLVRTRTVLPRPAESVWPLLCDSRVTLTPRCPVFRLGVPRPVECRLPEGVGGEGALRQCVSDQGSIRQRITEWRPPRRLTFHMEHTDLAFARCVDGLTDQFELRPLRAGTATLLTRTTRVEIRGRFRCLTQAAVYVGLKAIHRHAFRAWRAHPCPAGSREVCLLDDYPGTSATVGLADRTAIRLQFSWMLCGTPRRSALRLALYEGTLPVARSGHVRTRPGLRGRARPRAPRTARRRPASSRRAVIPAGHGIGADGCLVPHLRY